MLKILWTGLILGFVSQPALAAKDGENWEVSMQTAEGSKPLGPAQVHRLCFAKGKDMKEPPQNDPSCKTSVQQSGKRATFKSVCKDGDTVITSSGFSEEVGPTHFRSDITIITEEKGSKLQHRQVGNIKKLTGSCDPSDFSGFMKNAEMRQGGKAASDPPAARQASSNEASRNEAMNSSGPDRSASTNPSEGKSDSSSLIQTGKGILKGLLPF